MANSDFRLVYLPYCLLRQEDGSYVVTNRRYKPVGMTVTDHVDYMALPVRVKFKRLTAASAARIDVRGRAELDRIYLYNDSTVPTLSQADWDAYCERLRRLAALKLEIAAA